MQNNLENKEIIFEELQEMAITLGANVTSQRINLYTEHLNAYDVDKTINAIRQGIKEFEFFPSLAQLIKIIEPQLDDQDKSNEMAGAIIEAITEFGIHRGREVRNSLGEQAWFAIERFGGWSTLCETTYDQLPAIRAQLRGVCKSTLAAMNRSNCPDLLKYEKTGLKRLNFDCNVKKLTK